ncbi:MAG TPA: capsular polysaccharide biosynthesis protein [Rhodobacteraceae bacterium]|nr:capsular polysaccharide biosynthesis protein [Paracoccaceae bacterium]
MPTYDETQAADGETRRRLFVYNGGFLTQSRIRRILQLAGYDIRLGKPSDGDMVGVWGKSPTSPRGEAVASHTDAPILRVEDAFLRSIHPGRSGEPPLGLLLDKNGVHFDPSTVSDLETLLATHPLDDTALLNRARNAMARIKVADLSKYNAHDPDIPLPAPGYVLVIDQTKGDASVTASGADRARFQEMLVFAQEENPGAQVIIKTHPETLAGHRKGYYSAADTSRRVSLLTEPVSPWALMDGAIAVYTVSSQLGFEAIMAGHKPRVFGTPFYAGWGLTQDETPLARRQRVLTRAQLFAAAMILYPEWYDPYRDRLCALEDVVDALEVQVRAWREDRRGYVATGMRLWKRAPLQAFYGRYRKMRFAKGAEKARALARQSGAKRMVWAGRETVTDEAQLRIEDGFLRSRGLGANLTAPLSLVADDLGIYYDPTQESRLERLIAASVHLGEVEQHRAKRLVSSLTHAGVSKYNVGSAGLPDLPKGRRILVPGQVEDDASVRKGCSEVSSNLDLLKRVRRDNPDAVILYKPHPDVEAGLRNGAVPVADLAKYADLVLKDADPVALIDVVDEVWTMTSLLGFEALLRGREVTCLGMPFYAGWGLTQDMTEVPERRQASPTLAQMVHAVLIDYPRYYDPVADLPCPPEVIVERLQHSELPPERMRLRLLAKVQGIFASYAHLWR